MAMSEEGMCKEDEKRKNEMKRMSQVKKAAKKSKPNGDLDTQMLNTD